MKRIVIDGREFLPDKRTGIGRFLEGLIDALADSVSDIDITLACFYKDAVPLRLKNRERLKVKEIPRGFLFSEKSLSNLTKQATSLYISPYPKLPVFGFDCPAVHTIHDVLDLKHPAYVKRPKIFFDRYRLKKALKRASLTWYVSSWSLKQTKEYVGRAGRNPRVRFNALDKKFTDHKKKTDRVSLEKYDLTPGHIVVIGNGLPHKNLGVLLNIGNQLKRETVFVGVSEQNQKYWRSRYPNSKGVWITHVRDEDLPAIMREAFCLAQPSTEEGYGYPPMEAMACGLPAVVSKIPVLIETSGGNALLADPADPKEWINAFDALENKNTYQNQVEKALRWVAPFIGRKGWQKHISDIWELLEYNGKK